MSSVGTLAWHAGTATKGTYVNIGNILASGVSSLLGILLAGWFVNRQGARAERDWQAARAVTVRGSIRNTRRRRLGGMWRHGTVDIVGSRVVWTPRTPWGRSLELGAVGFGLQRSPEGPLRFQLPPAAIVVPCSDAVHDLSAQHGYELAVLPASVKYLYGAQFAA